MHPGSQSARTLRHQPGADPDLCFNSRQPGLATVADRSSRNDLSITHDPDGNLMQVAEAGGTSKRPGDHLDSRGHVGRH